MATASALEYGDALEQACVQLKMLQCALWTKDQIDEDDETALRLAMMTVRKLQRELHGHEPTRDPQADPVKPQKVKRSWSRMLSRSFRKIVGKQQREPTSTAPKVAANRADIAPSTASTASSVAWSQESMHEDMEEGDFVFHEQGVAIPNSDNTVRARAPTHMMVGTLPTSMLSGRLEQGQKTENLEQLEAKVEKALRKVLIEFSKKSQPGATSGDFDGSQTSVESGATGQTAEHRASGDLTLEVNNGASPTAAKIRIARLAAAEAMAKVSSDVISCVEKELEEVATNPPSQSVSIDMSEPEVRTPHRSPDVLESTAATIADILQSLSPGSSPSKPQGSPPAVREGVEASNVCEAPIDPAVQVRNEGVSEIGDELLSAIALLSEEHPSNPHQPLPTTLVPPARHPVRRAVV